MEKKGEPGKRGEKEVDNTEDVKEPAAGGKPSEEKSEEKVDPAKDEKKHKVEGEKKGEASKIEGDKKEETSKDEKREKAEEEKKEKPAKDKKEETPTDTKKHKIEEEIKEKAPDIPAEEVAKAAEEAVEMPEHLVLWKPRTDLGKKVQNGEKNSMKDILAESTPIKEVEIVDTLLPELSEEILDLGRVQRVTDSGRRMRFRVVAAVGNGNGYIGLGEAKGKEAGPAIRKAIERAKLNMIEVKRGCGSWECGCGNPHTVPFKVSGKASSVRVDILPAPMGVGLVSGEIPKKILTLAGIRDAWVHTKGHTRTSLNFSHAILNALNNTKDIKINDKDIKTLNIVSGSV